MKENEEDDTALLQTPNTMIEEKLNEKMEDVKLSIANVSDPLTVSVSSASSNDLILGQLNEESIKKVQNMINMTFRFRDSLLSSAIHLSILSFLFFFATLRSHQPQTSYLTFSFVIYTYLVNFIHFLYMQLDDEYLLKFLIWAKFACRRTNTYFEEVEDSTIHWIVIVYFILLGITSTTLVLVNVFLADRELQYFTVVLHVFCLGYAFNYIFVSFKRVQQTLVAYAP